MTPQQLREIESTLWEAADELRANSKLTATEYSMPVLGLIFLRHATNRFLDTKEKVEKTLPSRGGEKRELTPQDFVAEAAIYLPEEARYDYLAALPEGEDLGAAINNAMRLIEEQVPEQLDGVLPKDYAKFDKDLLANLVRIFNRRELRQATTDDLFGRIYEYFLNKFAMSGAQEGGEFFTPPSLVRTIVNFIEPTHGRILDPACGSAGMFVQAGHAIEEAGNRVSSAVTFYGQEKSETNTRLARMNLAVHGLEGAIRQGNTFYDRWEEHIGSCDFVMANPPFNVDGVDPQKVKGDPRLFTKKKIPGISAKTKTVSNANYLWMQYFRAYLSESGRAGFVMAQSATDAGHGEKAIRQELVETGDVDIIVSIGTNFFYTRTLPCSLWFYDRGKPVERRDKTLMLDARGIYRVVSRVIRDFSEEQLANLTAIVWLYRGEEDRYLELIRSYLQRVLEGLYEIGEPWDAFDRPAADLLERLEAFGADGAEAGEARDAFLVTVTELKEAIAFLGRDRSSLLADLATWRDNVSGRGLDTNDEQIEVGDSFEEFLPRLTALRHHVNDVHRLASRAVDQARKDLGANATDAWVNREIKGFLDTLDEARHLGLEAIKGVTYPFAQVTWLQNRFPDARMADVPGLCKVVSREEIEAQDWSLTPGRYVGVAPPEPEDEEHVETRLRAIHTELAGLNEEASILGAEIIAKFSEFGE